MIPQFDIIRIYALRSIFLRASYQLRTQHGKGLSLTEIRSKRAKYAKELGQ